MSKIVGSRRHIRAQRPRGMLIGSRRAAEAKIGAAAIKQFPACRQTIAGTRRMR
jgi:hypothetical protein